MTVQENLSQVMQTAASGAFEPLHAPVQQLGAERFIGYFIGWAKIAPACAAEKPMKSWWAFLDAYRTLCVAPSHEIRELFEQLRHDDVAELIR